MDEAREQSGVETGRGSGVFRWVWIAGLILVIYVLSIGPVVKMAYRSPAVDASVDVIYAPLSYVTYYWPAASRFLKWYIEDAWGNKGATGF